MALKDGSKHIKTYRKGAADCCILFSVQWYVYSCSVISLASVFTVGGPKEQWHSRMAANTLRLTERERQTAAFCSPCSGMSTAAV